MRLTALKSALIAALPLALALVAAPSALAAITYPIPATPIPSASPSAAAAYTGAPAAAHAVKAAAIPVNPWMAPAPWNNVHNDAYMSDTYPIAGPLGRNPVVTSNWLGAGYQNGIGYVCVAGFDDAGNMVAPVIRAFSGLKTAITLTLLDPVTLDVLAEYDLPGYTRTSLLDRLPGTYFYMDEQGRVVVGTTGRELLFISHTQTASGWAFAQDGAAVDLTASIPEDDKIQALQPDYSGRIWVTSKGGVVCTVDPATRTVLGTDTSLRAKQERIANGHAAGKEGGVYIVSTRAMYRFDADRFGRPVVTWRAGYGAGDRIKPGQVDLGSGTTPTLMGGKYVAITDNADPYMHVLVYRRAKQVSGQRLVAKVKVFGKYQGSNENSLVCTGKSIVVENNYGYVNPFQDTMGGLTTTPGLARIDLDKHGKARKVWTNSRLSIPSGVTKMSLKNGLIYTYSKPAKADGTDAWYFTAVDFRTGKVLWKQLAGTGYLYDNDYASVYLGKTGTLYVGVNGGVAAVRDQ